MTGYVIRALAAHRSAKAYGLVLLLCLLLTACSSDSTNGDDAGEQNIFVEFTIYMGDDADVSNAKPATGTVDNDKKPATGTPINDTPYATTADNAAKPATAAGSATRPTTTHSDPATRAADDIDWTRYDPAEDGEGIENRLDINRLHVLLYTADDKGQLGQLAGEVRNLTLRSTDNKNEYRVYGNMEIPKDRLTASETFSGRVVVVANADAPADWTPAQLDRTVYAYESSKSVGTPQTLTLNSIPMWGISPVLSMTLKGGTYNDLGTIDLLRAMAKVTVSLGDDMVKDGFTLKAVTLSPHNTSGSVMPAMTNVATLGPAEGTRYLTYDESFHLPGGVTADQVPLSFATEGSTRSLTLYLPEYDNVSTGATPATIGVTALYHGREHTATLQFRGYSGGRPTGAAYNIVRNHHYNYVVYNSGLSVNLHVTPWVKFEHEPFSW